MQGLQAQVAVRANDDLDPVTFLQARLPQAVGRKSHGQAVAPAADRLLEVTACVSRSILGLGLLQGTLSSAAGQL